MPSSKIEEIFHAAMEIDSLRERSAFVEQSCLDDDKLRSEVEALLQSYQVAGGFLEESPTLSRVDPAVGTSRDGTQHPNQPDPKDVMKIDQLPCSFGEYELIELIAEGGMGVVFKARQHGLDRVVAIKMILSGQLAGQDDIKRFYVEAEAAGNLDHPGIVPVYEVGCCEGQHYFSMAFIEGENLVPRIKAKDLSPREAAMLTKKIAQAIQSAHDRGIVHRDLKPGNVLLDQRGEPRITDFGLAKRMTGEGDLTATGTVLGTPNYMSPEQAAGKGIGPTSDVYSMGAILFAMLTGRAPFEGASQVETMIRVLHDEPPSPRQINTSVAKDLEVICLKCLEKDPSNRYQTSDELADDLQRYLSGEPIRAKEDLVRRIRKWTLREPVLAAHLAATVFMLVIIMVNYCLLGESLDRHWQMMWKNIGLLIGWAMVVVVLQKIQNRYHTKSVIAYAWAMINPVFLTLILSQNAEPRGSLLSLYLLLMVITCFSRRIELVVTTTVTAVAGFGFLAGFCFTQAEVASRGYLLVFAMTLAVTGWLLGLLSLRLSRLGKQNLL